MGAKQSQEGGTTVASPPVAAVSDTRSSASRSSHSLSGSHHPSVTLQEVAMSRAQRELPRPPPPRPHHSHSLRSSSHVSTNATHSSRVQNWPSDRERDRGREFGPREGDTSRPHRVHSGHSRPAYVDVDFTIPSLDQRLVARSRSHGSGSGPRQERRHRVHSSGGHGGSGRRRIALSTSAPFNSLVLVRELSSE